MLGGILSDSYWGKVKTVSVMALIYLIGMVILTVSALPQVFTSGLLLISLGGAYLRESLIFQLGGSEPETTNIILAFIGLLIVSVGNGGVKPCIASLGGDQFADKGKISLSE